VISQDALQQIRQYEGGILVVTDRYPPNAHGGAELSLHIMLSSLAKKDRILVLTFNEAIESTQFYEHDGVGVIELPFPTDWPYHHHTIRQFARVQDRKRPARAAGKFWMLCQYFARTNPLLWPRRIRMLYQAYLVGIQGGMPADFEQFDNSLRKRLVEDVILAMQPRLIHADNYRSILTVAALADKTRAKLVGQIRDNRFYCMNHNQSMTVNGRPCGICKFECYDRRRKNVSFVTGLMEKNRQYRQGALRKFDGLIVTSRFLDDQITSIVNKAIVYRVANPADSPEEVFSAIRGVAELPGFNILIVGMLNENKGQLELAKELDRLVARVPDAKLYFAGRGQRIEKRIIEIAEEKGLADRVEFLGYLDRSELYKWMRRCQVVALPTMWPEPFGRVPLEAGLVSRPVVAYKIGGLAETILDGETGFLIEHRKMEAFIDALADLSRDKSRIREMGYAACERVRALYGSEELGSQIHDIWTSLR